MKKQPNKRLAATTTRNVLSGALVIIVIGAVVGFYFGLQGIKSYALDVSHDVSDSTASAKNVEELGSLKTQLADAQTLVSKADKLFSTADSYQTDALRDLSRYASASGVTISGIESAKPSADTNTPAAGATAAPTAAVAPTNSQVITLESPVAYDSFLKFLDAIEGNLPKMQITDISIGRPKSGPTNQITTDKITITVSVR